MDSEKVLLGFLAGVAVGATLGILFAPDKGSNTRKKIARRSNEYAEGIKEKFNEILENVNTKLEELSEEETTGANANNGLSRAEATQKEVSASSY